MAGQITIRQAGESDAETVSSILREAAAWLIRQGAALWMGDELHPEKIRQEVSGGLFYLAAVDGEVAGCVRFQLEDRLFWPDIPAGESAFIHRLAVRRRFAGGAVSIALIEWAKARARRHGRKYLRLDCKAEMHKLCALYESNGFRKHSERQVGPYRAARYECKLNEGQPPEGARPR